MPLVTKLLLASLQMSTLTIHAKRDLNATMLKRLYQTFSHSCGWRPAASEDNAFCTTGASEQAQNVPCLQFKHSSMMTGNFTAAGPCLQKFFKHILKVAYKVNARCRSAQDSE